MRVLPDVAGLDRPFDYLVPDRFAEGVTVGTRVRVALQGRRVGGWVVADDVTPPPGVELRSVTAVAGLGPPADVVDLAGWAAWRWAGRRGVFLATASPPRVVRDLPPPAMVPARSRPADPAGLEPGLVEEALAHPISVVRLAPAVDPYPLVEAAARSAPLASGAASALVVAPSQDWAARLADRLGRDGFAVALVPDQWADAAAGGRLVVGTRSATWAPLPGLAVVVVLDAHDEAHGETRAPTWNAGVVAVERARRSSARCLLVSACPSLEILSTGRLVTTSRRTERLGWSTLEVVDRRKEDPRSGLFSERLVALAREAGPDPSRRVVCVLNRTGRGRLIACGSCGELGSCERCQGPLSQSDTGETLRCRRCGQARPDLCGHCGSRRWRVLRPGVARIREELEALAGRSVGEVTSKTDDPGALDAPVVVGTEAVLHRLRRAAVVVFLDFDQELLAPRYRAGEQALALLVRAARLVGGRQGRGRVVVQTRMPGHEVIDAGLHADPGRLAAVESDRRSALGLPPFSALAVVSGSSAEDFVAGLDPKLAEAMGPDDGRFLVRAAEHRSLCDALAGVSPAAARPRIEVDPERV